MDGVAARGLVNGRSRTVHENVRWTFGSEHAAGVNSFHEDSDEPVLGQGEGLVTHREVKPCRFVDHAFEM